MTQPVRVLSRADVERLLSVPDCIGALDRAFRTADSTRSFVGGVAAEGGMFHMKAALASVGRPLFVSKLNANFPENPRARGLPTIQGVLLLCDGESGTPLALMDSAAVTIIRTAAASGLVARHLAPETARRAAIIGCGAQALAQLQAMCAVRELTSARVYDSRADVAESFARDATARLGITVSAARSISETTDGADIIVTCTTSRRAVLEVGQVAPGAFVAAVGADSADKQEIAADLLASAMIVVDDLAQCAEIGDLHHAIAAGTVRMTDVWGSIADLFRKPIPPPDGRPIVFDSTGIPLEDVAAAGLIYEGALAQDVGNAVTLH